MINISVKLTGSVNVFGLGADSNSLFRKAQMEKLGNFAIATIKARVAKGIGSDDAPMPPLSQKNHAIKAHGRKFVRQAVGYAAWKAQHGLQPRRDLMGTGKDGGHMLDNISVRLVSETGFRISLTRTKARAKALANEKRAGWFEFSNGDERLIVGFAEKMFREAVESIGRGGPSLRLPSLKIAA